MTKKKLHQGSLVPVKEGKSSPDLPLKQEIAQAGGFDSLVQASCGCQQKDVSHEVVLRCLQASASGVKKEDLPKEMQLVLHELGEMAPRDFVESALASSFLALHRRGMSLLGGAGEMNLNLSLKLLRLRHETLEALLKWRRRGEQRVIVSHLNLESGSVVGNLLAGGGVVKMEASTEPTGGTVDASQA